MDTHSDDHSSTTNGVSNVDQLPRGDGAPTNGHPDDYQRLKDAHQEEIAENGRLLQQIQKLEQDLAEEEEKRGAYEFKLDRARTVLRRHDLSFDDFVGGEVDPEHLAAICGDQNSSQDDFQIQTATDLVGEDLDPLRPLVTTEDRTVLPEGTTLLAAKPKVGKSFLAMNVAVGIASGGKALGHAAPRQGRVLYLNLDGWKRGTQQRIEAMFGDEPCGPPDNLHFLHGSFPTVGDGGLPLLDEWCSEHPDTELVIVDVLEDLWPATDGRRNLYREEYDLLSSIADKGREHDTSILLVHHLNKLQDGDALDKVSGSTALTGAVENVLLLDSERGSSEATLEVYPREGPDERFTLEFDDQIQTWVIGGLPTPNTPEREEVWNVLQEADGALQLGDIAGKVGKQKNAVSNLLTGMYQNGIPVERTETGSYRAG